MATTVGARPSRTTTSSLRAGAVVVGVAFGFAVEGITAAKTHLSSVSNAEAAMWPIWAIFGLFALLGVATAAMVLMSPREPLLPTAAAAVLLYGLVASIPTELTWRLPYLGEREFVLVPTLAGVMTAAAVWSWWLSRPRRGGA